MSDTRNGFQALLSEHPGLLADGPAEEGGSALKVLRWPSLDTLDTLDTDLGIDTNKGIGTGSAVTDEPVIDTLTTDTHPAEAFGPDWYADLRPAPSEPITDLSEVGMEAGEGGLFAGFEGVTEPDQVWHPGDDDFIGRADAGRSRSRRRLFRR